MAEKIEEYKKMVIRALKSAKKYTHSLDIQVLNLASALRALDMANKDLDEIECTYIKEESRYGSKLVPHPSFSILKTEQDIVTRQMKSLGLTSADLSADVDADPLADLTKAVKKTGLKPLTIRPKKD